MLTQYDMGTATVQRVERIKVLEFFRIDLLNDLSGKHPFFDQRFIPFFSHDIAVACTDIRLLRVQ